MARSGFETAADPADGFVEVEDGAAEVAGDGVGEDGVVELVAVPDGQDCGGELAEGVEVGGGDGCDAGLGDGGDV